MPIKTLNSDNSVDSFREEANQLVGQLRTALMKVINECTDGIKRSRDIQELFGLNMTVSWQVYRILNNSENFFELCPHIPSAGMTQKLLVALKRRGATKESMANLAEAHAQFENFVEHTAGDRGSFDVIMAKLIGGSSQSQIELAHRRAAFECERYVWGVELETAVYADILGPSFEPGQEFGHILLRQKRNMRRLGFDQVINVFKRAAPSDRCVRLPLDQEAFGKHGIPLLPEFCTSLDLPLRRKESGGGVSHIDWIGESMGRQFSADFAVGEIANYMAGGKFSRVADAMTTRHMFTFGTPTHLHVIDLLVHRATFGIVKSEVTRWGHSMDAPPMDVGLEEMGLPKLPCHDRVAFIGSGADAAYMPESHNYVAMLEFACKKAGWKLSEFDVYRVRMEYPLMHTMTAINYSFPLQTPH